MATTHGTFTFPNATTGDVTEFIYNAPLQSNATLPAAANTDQYICWDSNGGNSSNVGPDQGADGVGDGYLYSECSSPGANGDEYLLEFDTDLDASAEQWQFNFYTCQRGPAIGNNQTLCKVQISEGGGTWFDVSAELGGSGNDTTDGTAWTSHSIDLSQSGANTHATTRVRVRWESQAATTWHADYGVDSIQIVGTDLVSTPSISGFDSGDWAIGETGITLTGTGFEAEGANSRIRIDSSEDGDGISQTQVDTSWSDTSIQFTASLGSLSYGSNYVFVRNQSLVENTIWYQINLYAPITVTSISDSTLYDGQTLVEFNGSGFGSSQGTSEIWVSNAPAYLADPDQQEQTVTSWTDTKITFTVDIGLLSLGTSYVFVSRAQASLGDNPLHISAFETITLVAAPAIPIITSIDGDNIIVFGQSADIVGSNFEALQGTGRVDFCAAATYGSPVAQGITTWADGLIKISSVQGVLSAGVNYLFVENDTGLRNATGFAFTASEPASSDGLYIEASIQNTISSSGLTTTAFMVRDE